MSFLAELRKITSQVTAENVPVDEVHRTIPAAGEQELEHRIQQAVTEAQMEQVAADIDAAYHQGDLEQGAAEELAERLLKRSRNGAQQHLDELFALQPVVRVDSRVLGEVVRWVRDEAAIPPGAPEVAYTHNELKTLVGRSPEAMRRIHAAKKALDVEVVSTHERD